jgi:hypothetical protein
VKSTRLDETNDDDEGEAAWLCSAPSPLSLDPLNFKLLASREHPRSHLAHYRYDWDRLYAFDMMSEYLNRSPAIISR